MALTSNTIVLDTLQAIQNARNDYESTASNMSVYNNPIDPRYSSESNRAEAYMLQIQECRRLLTRFSENPNNTQILTTLAKERDVLCDMTDKAQKDLRTRMETDPARHAKAIDDLQKVTKLQREVGQHAANAGVTGFEHFLK